MHACTHRYMHTHMHAGPGSAMEFSLSVLSAITDQENAEKVKKSLACEDNLRIVN